MSSTPPRPATTGGSPPRALIVGSGAGRGALAGARALHAAGWRVGIASPAPALAGASRACAHRHAVPPPAAGREAFTDAVRAAVAAGSYQLVFGAGDAEVLALSLSRDDVGAMFPSPPHAALVSALDKLQLTEAARAAGLATPRTWTDPEGVREHDGPVIVKARVHGAPDRDGAPDRFEACLAPDAPAAERRADEIRELGGEPLLQEVVRGRLLALATVRGRDGRLLAAVQQEALGMWPRDAGVTARGRTMPVDPQLREVVAALLERLDWFGLAQVQFLAPADGAPRLIDLNGRFYGSLALAVGAGVNLPAIWAAAAQDRPPPAAARARPARYQWLEGDLRRAVAERRGGLLADVAGTLRYAVGARHSVASLRDPGPALRLTAGFARRAYGRRPAGA